MISKKDLEEYKLPDKIDFKKEERRLRLQNLKEIQNFLHIIDEHPHMMDDFKNLSKNQFINKYNHIVNASNIYRQCNNFIIKFTNFCENFNVNLSYLIKKLKEDYLFAATFIVDFKRQNPYEPFVEKYFKFLEDDLKLFKNWKHLHVSGPTALYVYNGLIQNDSIKKRVQTVPPSVDFTWQYEFENKKMNFYASHKYTSGEGTAQKNQMRDLEKFLDHSLQSAFSSNDYFVAIMDGNYYTENSYPNYQGDPKPKVIDHIRQTKQNKKCKVSTSYDFIYVVVDMIKSWLIENFSNIPSKKELLKEELEKLNILISKLK